MQASTLPTLEDWPRVLDMAFALIDAAALLDDDPTEKRPAVRNGATK